MRSVRDRGWEVRTWTALGAKIAKDDNSFLAFLERPVLHGCDELILRVESTSLACKAKTFLTRDFRNGTAWCKVSSENSYSEKMNVLVDMII